MYLGTGVKTPENHDRYTHEIDGNLLSDTQMPDGLYQVSAWKIARFLGRVRERRSAFNLRMILPFPRVRRQDKGKGKLHQ